MSQEKMEIVREMIDAWNCNDFARWRAPTHADLEWFPAIQRQLEGGAAMHTGEADLRGFFEEWHAQWHLHFRLTDTRVVGDSVLALAQITTTGPASGIEVERSIAYLCEFEDGQVRRARAYLSAADALEAMGLSE